MTAPSFADSEPGKVSGGLLGSPPAVSEEVSIRQRLEDLRVIERGVAVGHVDMPPSLQWSEQHEQIGIGSRCGTRRMVARVGPAESQLDRGILARFDQVAEPGIAVHLESAPESVQAGGRVLTPALSLDTIGSRLRAAGVWRLPARKLLARAAAGDGAMGRLRRLPSKDGSELDSLQLVACTG